LPEIVQFKNGNQIRNKYNAAGQKLSSRNITVEAGVYQPLNPGQIIENLDVNENDNVTVEGMDYIGNIEYQIYRFFDWDVTFEPVEYKYLSKIHNPEGYATSATTSNGPIYYYYRRDHLGNNREVWRASYTWGSTTHAAATVQRTQYYPSGLPWKYNNGDNPGSQPYKYNGKEYVEMHGLDEYDSEARWYYPAIMRTTTMDPHAENYYSISPYAWCANNPVRMVDPDGRDIKFWIYVGNKAQEVDFSKLDINLQKAIVAFAKTDVGYNYLKQFAKKGDSFGSKDVGGVISFKSDGKNAIHNQNIMQMDLPNNPDYFGDANLRTGKDNKLDFDIRINVSSKYSVLAP
jgi:RHS repeat-associated protein